MDIEKRFDIMASIMRASHFEWRRAALKLCPDLSPLELVKQYWEEVGKDTAKFYLRKIDPEGDLPKQLAELFVSSSVAMGEDAELLADDAAGKVQARHNDCPWFHWHTREGLLSEDQPGCDHWLSTVVTEINKALGSQIRWETVQTLPAGDSCCLRHFWQEKV